MWPGTAALQSGQVFKPGAFQRFDIARIFCLEREERLLGTAMGWWIWSDYFFGRAGAPEEGSI